MQIKTSRLPRRYDHVMKTLRSLMASKGERIRFQAAMRISEILLTHQQAEERLTIAAERAAARKAEAAEQRANPGVPESADPVSREDAIRQAQEFLARIKEKDTVDAAE
jgi:hypothetical protein